MIRDEKTGQYGLLRFDDNQFWKRIDNSIKPDPIKDHGTVVVLLGDSINANTIDAPPKAQMPKGWVARYLNDRFLRFPEGVDVQAREGWDLPREQKHNFLRRIRGAESYLNDSCQSKGSLSLPESNATAHWWILRDDVSTKRDYHHAPGAQIAALYQDELYEMAYGNSGIAQLQRFGIVFGCQRIVLYIEPNTQKSPAITSNTARTHLLSDGERLNWSAYASEFRDNMPEEIAEYQDALGQLASNKDHREAIRERLKTMPELFRFPRYRPSPSGQHRMADSSSNGGGVSRGTGNGHSGKADSGGSGRSQDIYSIFSADDGQRAEVIIGINEPKPIWVSEEDGTRTKGDMEERAARYLPDTNELLINDDFRVFTDMIDRWKLKYESISGAGSVIKDVVREWFEQQLMETVMSALALKHGGKWSDIEISQLWTEESLTAAVLPRYHINTAIKRTLGHRLGKPAKAA